MSRKLVDHSTKKEYNPGQQESRSIFAVAAFEGLLLFGAYKFHKTKGEVET
jgi:hypothetical protein